MNSFIACNNTKNASFNFVLAPSLTVTATVNGVTSSNPTVCPGTTVAITARGASAGSAYNLLANGTVIQSNLTGDFTVTPSTSTTYTVTTNTAACGSNVVTQNITVLTRTLSASASPTTVCPGQASTLTASYTNLPSGFSASYSWRNTTTGATSTANPFTVTPSATTTYELTANGGCGPETRLVAVTVGTPVLTVSPSSANICSGSVLLTSSFDRTVAGTTYVWSVARADGTTASGFSTAATYTANPSQTSTYTLTATVPGCGTVSSSATVTVQAATLTLTPNSSACAGTPATLTAVSNKPNAAFSWTATSGGATTTLPQTTSSISVSPTATTSYTVTATATGCSTLSRTSTITVNPTVTVTPSQTTQAGASRVLTATGGSTSVYNWTATVGGTTTPLASQSASITVAPVYTTTYTVTGTTANGLCRTASTTITVVRPLPVELVSFDAVWAGKTPVLAWATASEKNNDYFAIERSFDGVAFQTIGKVAGAGSTSARTSYQYADGALGQTAATTVYYRLQQVDTDGTTNFSPVRSLQIATVAAREFKANVFPNPYDTKVAVRVNSLGTDAISFTVRNVLGQTVLTKTVSTAPGEQDVELAAAAALLRGMYYLTVRQGNEQQVLRLSHR
ncbi:T9SS type A sorting domain-containing protein [Hymenobacter sp. IS2118]|uniref:T9SS type A sorting domain-containing protein n=1 Tax=Hymenobacter sp. IS2118 TaxID=1505605 RepID=UPI001377BD5B|nr:T9SS type A sorting domain-containing protein [Hymenobacter sp. IS2118]